MRLIKAIFASFSGAIAGIVILGIIIPGIGAVPGGLLGAAIGWSIGWGSDSDKGNFSHRR